MTHVLARPILEPVSCFLLTWNPKRWDWTTLADDLVQVALGRAVEIRWSSGNTRRVVAGDRVFLLKQGTPPRGLMASGTAATNVFEAEHWDPARAAAGDNANYVTAHFDRFLSPDGVLPVEQLEKNLGGMNWLPAAGGFEVPSELVVALEALWDSHVPPRAPLALSDELTPGVRYVEGAVQQALVNRYERDPHAREACLKAHGLRCAVCGFSFQETYGALGEGFIHVHHLVPISAHGNAHAVDAVQDLRPMCANCHAMIHRREPPLTIDELRSALAPRA